MKQLVKLAACLIAAFCTVMASAQLPSTQDSAAAQATTSPAAYVYVINNPSGNISQLNGYSAASNGALTPLAGSPFWTTTKGLTAMAHTAHWLFVSDQAYIYSFSIASNGALKLVSSVNAAQHYSNGQTGAWLVLDHSGSTLYALADDGIGDNEFQFFAKNSTTGALTYFGSTGASVAYGYLDFLGNNRYAYGFGCFQDTTFSYGFSRGSDGSLTRLNLNVPIPTYPDGNYYLCMASANPANNLAIAMYLETAGGPPPGPPAWLGVYTADSSGNLSTNSTSQNMPKAAVGDLHQMATSPAGNLLAIGGQSGLQVFHFNGSNPITPYTGLLAVHEISRLNWDTHNHLYAISPSGGRLYSFTVTPTGHKQDPGSPYLVPNPVAITVLSK